MNEESDRLDDVDPYTLEEWRAIRKGTMQIVKKEPRVFLAAMAILLYLYCGRRYKSEILNLKWNQVDILKTDVEGLWWEFGQELLEKNIDFKYWVTEIEFNVGYSNDEILDKIEELCKQFKNKGYEVANAGLKMLELYEEYKK